MNMKILATAGLVTLLSAGASGLAQTVPAVATSTPTATYINENQSDPTPLKLRDIDGTVRGLGGDAMPRASVSLFTEEGHSLVGTVLTDKDGKFRFDKVAKGFYRIVARVEGLCTANIPVLLESSLLAHRKVVITMRAKDIDTCSYGTTK